MKECIYPVNWWLGLTDEALEGEWVWYDTDTVAEFTGALQDTQTKVKTKHTHNLTCIFIHSGAN